VSQPLLSIKAHGLHPSVSEHLEHLSVLCTSNPRQLAVSARKRRQWTARRNQKRERTLAILLEDQLALVGLVLVLSPSAILASLLIPPPWSASRPRLTLPSPRKRSALFLCSVRRGGQRETEARVMVRNLSDRFRECSGASLSGLRRVWAMADRIKGRWRKVVRRGAGEVG
jgi:hypothetical protein